MPHLNSINVSFLIAQASILLCTSVCRCWP